MRIYSLSDFKIPTPGTPKLRSLDPRSTGDSSTAVVLGERSALSHVMEDGLANGCVEACNLGMSRIIDRYV